MSPAFVGFSSIEELLDALPPLRATVLYLDTIYELIELSHGLTRKRGIVTAATLLPRLGAVYYLRVLFGAIDEIAGRETIDGSRQKLERHGTSLFECMRQLIADRVRGDVVIRRAVVAMPRDLRLLEAEIPRCVHFDRESQLFVLGAASPSEEAEHVG